jgi:hypothetical protein
MKSMQSLLSVIKCLLVFQLKLKKDFVNPFKDDWISSCKVFEVCRFNVCMCFYSTEEETRDQAIVEFLCCLQQAVETSDMKVRELILEDVKKFMDNCEYM